MKQNPTLQDVVAAVEKAFAPDLSLSLTEDGHIFSRSPKTPLGWKVMRAIRGLDNIDDACKVAGEMGATLETWTLENQ